MCGGLLLLRHVTPLPRRDVVYFYSGAHIGVLAIYDRAAPISKPLAAPPSAAASPYGFSHQYSASDVVDTVRVFLAQHPSLRF